MAERQPEPRHPSSLSGPRALGRHIVAGLHISLVVAIILVGAVQVTRAVLFEPGPPAPYATCSDGLHELYRAVVRAREAAAHTDTGENAALGRFRDALQPEWRFRDGVAQLCRAAGDERALDAVERLRYAEEHAVRREAEELAPLRRRVQTIVDGELGAPSVHGLNDSGRSSGQPR